MQTEDSCALIYLKTLSNSLRWDKNRHYLSHLSSVPLCVLGLLSRFSALNRLQSAADTCCSSSVIPPQHHRHPTSSSAPPRSATPAPPSPNAPQQPKHNSSIFIMITRQGEGFRSPSSCLNIRIRTVVSVCGIKVIFLLVLYKFRIS